MADGTYHLLQVALGEDGAYTTTVFHYKKKDTRTACILWLALLAVYYFMGILSRISGFNTGILVNGAFALLAVWLASRDKEGLRTIGFTKVHAGKSAALGLCTGILILMLNGGAAGIISGRQWAPVGTLTGNFIYYLLGIALTEEIIFRGYMQTRMYGIVKKRGLAVVITGVMFVLLHIPFQVGYTGIDIFSYIAGNWFTLVCTFFWHIVFNFLYRKYNSILAPTIFHGLMDWSNVLFL